ncbi:MAG TPA: hypothetical protein VJ969_05910 [Desulfopila sp.]|nr:hypothetical protein [Desulfopila sp.]
MNVVNMDVCMKQGHGCDGGRGRTAAVSDAFFYYQRPKNLSCTN